MGKDEVISSLKGIISAKNHELNNWDVIYDRREHYMDDIYLYKCSFVDVYLYDDGSYFDVEPHMPPSFEEAYDHNTRYDDVDDSDLVNVLKSYVTPRDYDLNNWDTIIRNKVDIGDGVNRYKLSFGYLYLDKNNEFYDVDPFEVDEGFDVLSYDLSDDESLIVGKIKRYVPPQYYDLINWHIILRDVEEVEENIYHYPLHVMDLYLDQDYKPVTYDKCYIIDNKFYYDFNPQDVITDGQLTYITDLQYYA